MQWAEELADMAVRYGIGTFVLGSDDAATIVRFAAEVVPATRELVAAKRRAAAWREANVRSMVRTPYTHTPTPVSERNDERRIAGIDRRTVAPALLVLALAVLMSIALPQINSETEYSEASHKGDVVQLADGIRLVPAAGWNLASGALVGETRSAVGSTASTELVRGDVAFDVQAAPFEGTASALLTRIDEINEDLRRARGRTAQTTGRYTVTTRQGVVGVAEDFVSVTRHGSVIAFVFRPAGQSTISEGQPTSEGVEVVVSGPSGAMSRRRDDIVSMIRSIRTGS